MSSALLLSVVGAYVLLLALLAWWFNRGERENLSSFFASGHSAPWLLVAFGMVGTSLSGVTFVSVPGEVRNQGWAYLQVSLGYLLGYAVILAVLLPLYYRQGSISIYGWLETRFGPTTRRTGAVIFLVSRWLGSAARLYLAVLVLHQGVLAAEGVPFWVAGAVALGLILAYTSKGGIRTVVRTDVLQTAFMLAAAGWMAWSLAHDLGSSVVAQALSDVRVFWLDDPGAPQWLGKNLLAGMLIALAMTGLDQDMMQKNLSIRSLRQAQWNMALYSLVLVLVVLVFLALGTVMFAWADAHALVLPAAPDQVLPHLALHHLGTGMAVLFVLGLVAAAYSSADGSLAALTTSTCVDLLRFTEETTPARLRLKRRIHWAWTLLFFLTLLGLKAWQDAGHSGSLLSLILSLAGYTYGPLLGLYAFGLLSRRPVYDAAVPVVCVLSPVLTFFAQRMLAAGGVDVGFAHIALNAALTVSGLLVLRRRPPQLQPLPTA